MMFMVYGGSKNEDDEQSRYIYNISHGKLLGYRFLAAPVYNNDDMQGSPP